METNIPIYRAKKINRDEKYTCPKCKGNIINTPDDYHFSAMCEKYGAEMWYEDTIEKEINEFIEGSLSVQFFQGHFYYYMSEINDEDQYPYKIDATTLAIHFPDMVASDSDRLLPDGEKDLRIFASLSESGKGGDILERDLRKYEKEKFSETLIYDDFKLLSKVKGSVGLIYKITGIQE